jgi:hypothetical protein
MRRKRRKARKRDVARDRMPSTRRPTRKLWRDGHHEQYMLAWTSICRYRLAWIRMPDFDMPFGISCLIRTRSMLLFTRRQD